MRVEVVHRDLHAPALLQFPEGGLQQLEVKRPRVVEVVVVARRQGLFLRRQNLEHAEDSRSGSRDGGDKEGLKNSEEKFDVLGSSSRFHGCWWF